MTHYRESHNMTGRESARGTKNVMCKDMTENMKDYGVRPTTAVLVKQL